MVSWLSYKSYIYIDKIINEMHFCKTIITAIGMSFNNSLPNRHDRDYESTAISFHGLALTDVIYNYAGIMFAD